MLNFCLSHTQALIGERSSPVLVQLLFSLLHTIIPAIRHGLKLATVSFLNFFFTFTPYLHHAIAVVKKVNNCI